MQFFRAALLLAAAAAPVSAQSSLKLIPMPREVRTGAMQPLNQGVQVTCAAPCAPEDAFAVDDLKAHLTSRGVAVNAASPVNILVVRYGPAISRSILADASGNKFFF